MKNKKDIERLLKQGKKLPRGYYKNTRKQMEEELIKKKEDILILSFVYNDVQYLPIHTKRKLIKEIEKDNLGNFIVCSYLGIKQYKRDFIAIEFSDNFFVFLPKESQIKVGYHLWNKRTLINTFGEELAHKIINKEIKRYRKKSVDLDSKKLRKLQDVYYKQSNCYKVKCLYEKRNKVKSKLKEYLKNVENDRLLESIENVKIKKNWYF